MAVIGQGVYLIQSVLFPDRCYVGSAWKDIQHRWYEHKSELRSNKHSNKKLQSHYNKYGGDDLVYEVIEVGDYIDNNHLLAREQGWFDHFKGKDSDIPHFNLTPVAGSRFGSTMSEESKAKMLETWSVLRKDEETLRRIKEAGERRRGRKDSEETRRKKSKAQEGNKKGLGKVPWNAGTKGVLKHSEESRRRQSERMKGKWNKNFGKSGWNKGKRFIKVDGKYKWS